MPLTPLLELRRRSEAEALDQGTLDSDGGVVVIEDDAMASQERHFVVVSKGRHFVVVDQPRELVWQWNQKA
ncbi:hypothetical protein V6N12_069268 [Hibiscus sabdariffa]|uniref:Uncharacterized protein n=1 Tax=Hibiscus sabdariffa TaxID=183260 RepID=A0ABR2FDI6_9ROSI